ncbi:MAG: methyltransferase domain-containing protein [Planctomycetaceae bacterium]|nr:methyltransferase domain-containing protein [Planctomycetaceae bacterium]
MNVDLYAYDPDKPDSSRSGCIADAVGDMRDLQLPDDTIDEIFTSHTLEHFTRWEAVDMLNDWLRMLKPGAKLVMETPDFTRCILWLFHPSSKKRQLALNMFYGNQWDRHDFETHRYVWSGREIKQTLEEIGYRDVVVGHRTWTHKRGRDMRIEARK